MPYFDNNATTSPTTTALDAWLKASRENWQNPSSPYRSAGRVKNHLEACRKKLAGYLDCPASSIVFNSGATEGNNAVFSSFARICPPTARVVISSIEHPSVFETARGIFGDRVEFLPVDELGVLDADKLGEFLDSREVGLVSVMAANNETGVIQPWRKLLDACRRRGIPYHCDATQWMGKMPFDGLSNCDFVTGSAHKFGGPKGVGFMKVSGSHPDFRSLFGGGQESRYRGGTENYPSISGMVCALESAVENLQEVSSDQEARRSNFERELKQQVPGAKIVGEGVPRLWNTVSVIMPKFENTRWVTLLDKRGFIVSTGSACATGKAGPSHVLAAMGFKPDQIQRAVRISGGWHTSVEAWSSLAEAFGEVWGELNSPQRGAGNTIVVSV